MANNQKELIEDLKKLQTIEAELQDHIMKLSRTYRLQKNKTNLSIQKVKDAVQIIMGKKSQEPIKNFLESDFIKVQNLIREMGEDRHMIIFIRDEDGSGITEYFSQKQYKFDNNGNGA